LIAAVMSSVDSSLNSASTLITLDFIEKPSKPLKPKQTAKIGRILTLVLMTVSAIWAPLIESFPGLWFYLQAVLAFAIPPVVVLFLFGMLWTRGTAEAAYVTLWASHLSAVGLFILIMGNFLTLHFTYVAAILFVVGTIVYVTVSHVTPQPSTDQLKNLCYSKSVSDEAGQPALSLWKDYRWQSAFLVLFTCAVIILLW